MLRKNTDAVIDSLDTMKKHGLLVRELPGFISENGRTKTDRDLIFRSKLNFMAVLGLTSQKKDLINLILQNLQRKQRRVRLSFNGKHLNRKRGKRPFMKVQTFVFRDHETIDEEKAFFVVTLKYHMDQ